MRVRLQTLEPEHFCRGCHESNYQVVKYRMTTTVPHKGTTNRGRIFDIFAYFDAVYKSPSPLDISTQFINLDHIYKSRPRL